MPQIEKKITQKAARIDINPGQIIPACQSETKHTGAVNDSGRGGGTLAGLERLEFLQI